MAARCIMIESAKKFLLTNYKWLLAVALLGVVAAIVIQSRCTAGHVEDAARAEGAAAVHKAAAEKDRLDAEELARTLETVRVDAAAFAKRAEDAKSDAEAAATKAADAVKKLEDARNSDELEDAE